MGKRWTVQDREHNPIYLTDEQWAHIVQAHPEMAEYEQELKSVIRQGRRKQEPLNPRKYRYAERFDHLPDDFNQMVAIVLFELEMDEMGKALPNNWIATAFMKYIRRQGER